MASTIGVKNISENQNTASPTVTLTGVSAGSSIAVLITANNSSTRTISSVSDGTNTYAVANATVQNSGTFAGLTTYLASNVAAGSYTITVSTNGATLYDVAAIEIIGVTTTPKDATVQTAFTSSATSNSVGPTATLAQANEMALLFAYANSGGTMAFVDPGGWTRQVSGTVNTKYVAIWSQNTVVTTAITVTLSTAPTSSFMNGAILTLKDTAAPAGGGVLQLTTLQSTVYSMGL